MPSKTVPNFKMLLLAVLKILRLKVAKNAFLVIFSLPSEQRSAITPQRGEVEL